MTETTPGPASPEDGGRRVHLDNAGAAVLHPLARQAYLQALDDGWADPRRLHSEGRRARRLLDAARESIAAGLGARTEDVHLAPSHTAVLHAAVSAVRSGRRRAGDRVVASAVERAAVLNAAAAPLPGVSPATEARAADGRSAGAGCVEAGTVEAGAVEKVRVDATGRVDLPAFVAALTSPGVALAALQHANGEVGTLQPVAEAAEAARAAGVPLLVDAGASLGHSPVDGAWDVLAADPADWGSVPGVGVLAVRPRVRWRATWPEDADPWFPGGVSVPAAFAAAVTLEATLADRAAQDARRRELVDRIRGAAASVPDTEVVGDPDARLPHVVTFSCLYVDGEALVGELDRAGFAVGSGSACTASTLEPSHVLAAMGVLTHGNVRIALDRSTTSQDVERFCAVLPGAVARVRSALGVEGL
ncbi:cysteine desulfurase [Sediminihabitans luteus]|uniref:Cysteine desulfurase n=1 Tax=Sediminihabitans luteus TaxID=1138585 RepID=A0A2M9CQ66_9CELL|nr:aminotransferase class V-fold PLP-dependent enzyme [Sediminihabitans luteus]PJJ74039.1 cysteine desulfurase [Sediminihabitans luteus]GII98046.1 aminotransferase [Sediminihabitans luteus]